MPRRAAPGDQASPRAEEFTLDHPAVGNLAALAARALAAGPDPRRSRHPGPGLHAVSCAGDFPDARLILAHAGICDLSWIWRVAAVSSEPAVRHRVVDAGDLEALFSLVPPGRSCSPATRPTAHTRDVGRVHAPLCAPGRALGRQIRSISSEQSLRLAAGAPLQPAGPAVGERERASHVLLDRVAEFLMLGAIATMRGRRRRRDDRPRAARPATCRRSRRRSGLRGHPRADRHLRRLHAAEPDRPPPASLPDPGRDRGPDAGRAGARGRVADLRAERHRSA